MDGPALLEVRALRQAYGAHEVVRDLSFTLRRGAIGCLLGPSGCGKTTTLRMVAGFEDPTSGSITLEGADITHKPPNQRNVGMVFQA
jgi:ABC-type Fe3+/spermidine/putrescine transport system ATPase subunit